MRRAERRLAAALVFALAMATAAADTTVLQFSLPQDATTSAGLFDAQGRLQRTLWSGERLRAGAHRRAIEGGADGSSLQVLLLHHDVRPVWEGVVGNSSDRFVGPGVHRSMFMPSGLALTGDRLVFAVGYNEAQRALHALDPARPQRALRPFDSGDPFVALAMVAADRDRVYAANVGGLARDSFVLAFDVASGRRVEWAQGSSVCLARRAPTPLCHEAQDYRGVIDHSQDAGDLPSGIAVQRDGALLAVARPRRGQVLLFDKRTGRAEGMLRADLAPGRYNQIAFTPGGDLWLLTRSGAARWRWREGTPQLAARIEGLVEPLAIAVHPSDEDGVWIAQGGAEQRLLQIDRDGRRIAERGHRGGHVTEPRVVADRLCFAWQGQREHTALAVAADGSIWMVDTCNNRLLHWQADGSLRAQVAWLPTSYAAAADPNDGTRVFANFLEFRVEPGPLEPGRGWTLVRNWLPSAPRELRDDDTANRAFAGFRSVVTLAGGRTLALVGAGAREAIVELPAQGPMRLVRLLASPAAGATRKVLYENGDLGWARTGAGRQSVLRQRFLGFDASGEPAWSAEPESIASVPMLPGNPHERGGFGGTSGPRFPVTSSGMVVFFDSSVTGNEGFHLGAARLGTNEWAWMASPSAPLDGRGSFQTLEADRRLRRADRGIQYGGNIVMAHERHIVYGFHGEFYTDQGNGKVGQANQFMHFHDSGLFLTQFGLPSTRAEGEAEAGLSGNAFSPTLVASGDRLFLYHNDESAHGGVHRWRLDGWQQVRELRGSGPAGTTIQLR